MKRAKAACASASARSRSIGDSLQMVGSCHWPHAVDRLHVEDLGAREAARDEMVPAQGGERWEGGGGGRGGEWWWGGGDGGAAGAGIAHTRRGARRQTVEHPE